MTYDILVFDALDRLTLDEAQNLYEGALAGDLTSSQSTKIESFPENLASCYPALDERRSARLRSALDVPFEIEAGQGWVWLGIPRRQRRDVLTIVERLAFASGVAIYDPQHRRLRPEAVLRSE